MLKPKCQRCRFHSLCIDFCGGDDYETEQTFLNRMLNEHRASAMMNIGWHTDDKWFLDQQ